MTMSHKGIIMEINPGVVVGTKMASQANRMLCNINIVYNLDLKLSVVNAQEASGRCASCEALGHISMDCGKLKPVRVRCSIVPQARCTSRRSS